jgi:hypothetical protein
MHSSGKSISSKSLPRRRNDDRAAPFENRPLTLHDFKNLSAADNPYAERKADAEGSIYQTGYQSNSPR